MAVSDVLGTCTWIDCSTELAITSFPHFNEFRRTGKFCDVKIEAGGCIFYAHRIVLAATIPFFQLMFTSDLLESHTDTVNVNLEVDADTMEQILQFVYIGRLRCSATNLEKILSAADFFQLCIVSEKCINLLNECINTSNVLGIRRFAIAHNACRTVEAADCFIRRHFVEICSAKTSEFIELDENTLIELLSWDGLHVESEKQVYEAAIQWLEGDLEQRHNSALRVLSMVRMPLLTPEFLKECVSTNAIVQDSVECLNLVQEAINYQSVLNTTRINVRKCEDVPGIIFAIGGFGPRFRSSSYHRTSAAFADGDASPMTAVSAMHLSMFNGNINQRSYGSSPASVSSESTGSLVEMFDPLVGRWQLVEGAAMLSSRSGLGVAVVDRRLYAIGGFDGVRRLNLMEVFDPRTNVWSKAPDMAEKRSAMCVCVMNEKIYVFGGYDDVKALNSMEMFDTRTNSWNALPAMQSRRCAAAAVTLNGYIYAIGGHNGVTIFNTVERFNFKMNVWEKVTPMNVARCRLSAVTLDGKIYVGGGYNETFLNTMEVYDPQMDAWTTVEAMHLRRSRVSLLTTGGLIYAVGGYDGEHNLRSMEIYNPTTNTWQFGAQLVAHEGGVGAVVIPATPKSACPATTTNGSTVHNNKQKGSNRD